MPNLKVGKKKGSGRIIVLIFHVYLREIQMEMLVSCLIFFGSIGSLAVLFYLIFKMVQVLRETFGNGVLYFLGVMVVIIVVIALLFNFVLNLF